jgi:hypothetical protein
MMPFILQWPCEEMKHNYACTHPTSCAAVRWTQGTGCVTAWTAQLSSLAKSSLAAVLSSVTVQSRNILILSCIHLLFDLQTTHNLYYLTLLVTVSKAPHSVISSVSQLTCLPTSKVRYHLEDLGIDWRVTMSLILKLKHTRIWKYWSDFGKGAVTSLYQ